MCSIHSSLKEVICETCNTVLCPECITDHYSSCSKPAYSDIFTHVTTKTFPGMERLEKYITDSKYTETITEISDSLQELSKLFSKTVEAYAENIRKMTELLGKLKPITSPVREANYAERFINSLKAYKKNILDVLKKKDFKTAIKITRFIERSEEVLQKSEELKMIDKILAEGVEKLKIVELPQTIAEQGTALVSKLKTLGVCPYYYEWKCDKKHFPDLLDISEDGLTIGCKEHTGGRVCAIGDTPIKCGHMAFEVVCDSLSGEEVFGVTDTDEFKPEYDHKIVLIDVQSAIIGYSCKTGPWKMKGSYKSKLRSRGPYIVYLDLVSCMLRIYGPRVDVEAKLVPGREYVPCFICTKSPNKIRIQPLKEFKERIEKIVEEEQDEEVTASDIINLFTE